MTTLAKVVFNIPLFFMFAPGVRASIVGVFLATEYIPLPEILHCWAVHGNGQRERGREQGSFEFYG